MIVTGRSLFGFIHSNQLVAYQKLVPDEINITMIPNQEGGKPGQYLKPSMLLSMAETSADKDAAAELMSFFITDPDANAILQIERGVSGDASIREALIPGLRRHREEDHRLSRHRRHLGQPAAAAAAEERRRARPRAAPAWDAISFEQVDRRGRRQEVLRQRHGDPRARLSGAWRRVADSRKRAARAARARRAAPARPAPQRAPAICSCCRG